MDNHASNDPDLATLDPDAPPAFRFRLFVADDTDNSAKALHNLSAMCVKHLSGRHTIEIVDVFLEPDRAMADGVFMAPTLLRLAPLPQVRISGTLGEDALLAELGIGVPTP